MDLVSDSVLDDLASDSVLWQAQQWDGITIPVLPLGTVSGVAVPSEPTTQDERALPPAAFAERLAVLGLFAGLWGGAGLVNARKRRSGSLSPSGKPLVPSPK